MKSIIALIFGFLLIIFTSNCNNNYRVGKNNSSNDSTIVYCSPDLFNLTTKWVDEYHNYYPENKISVKKVAGTSLTDNPGIGQKLGFISGDYASMYDKSVWSLVVGRDVIIPIFNSANPFLNEIFQKGISLDNFSEIFRNQELRKWGTLLNNSQNVPVNLYMIDEESINSGIAKLLNISDIETRGVTLQNGADFISSLQNDPYSIGICKMTNLLEYRNQSNDEGIRLLPIDRNGNGEIDYMEKIYDNMDVLSRGVWIGKYPKSLFSNIYSISSSKPTDKVEVAFLKWVLTEGQDFLNYYGYNHLLLSERQSKVEMFADSKFDLVALENNRVPSKAILYILVSIIGLASILVMVIRYSRRIKNPLPVKSPVSEIILNDDFADIPLGLYYDKTHTWVFMEKNGFVRIGIDDFLQHITGPLTRVRMKSTGDRIRKGKPIMSIIQDGKQLNINAPISGTIKEYNRDLETDSTIINSSPYSDGWVYIIEPTNWLKEIQFLIMGKKYREWLKSEFSRLKEFLMACAGRREDTGYTPVFQDGGELKDGILADFGPEVWEDFQTNFIDLSS